MLARLPEVGTPATAAQPLGGSTATGAVAYRVDPAQRAATQRSVRREQRKPTVRVESPVLPSADPFSFPRSTWQEAQSSLVRFVLMVVLFTVAGTIIVMSKSNKQHNTTPPAPNTAQRHSLDRSASVIEPIVTTPTVKGPLQSASSQPSEPDAAILGPTLLGPVDAGEANGSVGASDQAAENTTETEELTSRFSSPPATSVAPSLPQLQVTSPPPATAQLSGYILGAPSQQASHDGDQQSIY